MLFLFVKSTAFQPKFLELAVNVNNKITSGNQKVFQDTQGNGKSVKETKAHIIIFSTVVHLPSGLFTKYLGRECHRKFHVCLLPLSTVPGWLRNTHTQQKTKRVATEGGFWGT